MSFRSDAQPVRHGNGSPGRGGIALFSSGQPGVGCTTLALNAALLLEQRGARTGPFGHHREIGTDLSSAGPRRAGQSSGVRYLAPGPRGNGHPGRAAPVGPHPGGALLLVDCPPGLSPPLLEYSAAADLLVVVVTPEPAALADGCGLLKLLAGHRAPPRTGIVVNKAASRSEAESVAGRLICTARQFFGRSIEALGYVPLDPHVVRADCSARPLSQEFPHSPASVCLVRVCERLWPEGPAARAGGLWPRLASLLL